MHTHTLTPTHTHTDRHKDVSQFMSGDVLKVAEKCWQQIHNRIGAAVEVGASSTRIYDHCDTLPTEQT